MERQGTCRHGIFTGAFRTQKQIRQVAPVGHLASIAAHCSGLERYASVLLRVGTHEAYPGDS